MANNPDTPAAITGTGEISQQSARAVSSGNYTPQRIKGTSSIVAFSAKPLATGAISKRRIHEEELLLLLEAA